MKLFFKILHILLALTCLLAGCEAQLAVLKPTLVENGELYLYVRALPHEANRLKFNLSQVLAVKDDGSEYPLAMAFKEFSPDMVKRQRFFASAALPPGDYVGLAIGVSGATLMDEEGEERLLVADKPVRIDCRFTIARTKATFEALALNYDQSVTTGYSFTPAFAISLAAKPVAGLVGYVSNYGSNTLTVFDKQYLEVVGIIATGAGPKGMAMDQARRRAYVALAREDAVQVLDVALGEEISRIRLKPEDAPQELALTADGRTLLAVNYGSDTVSFIDPLSYLELTRVKVGSKPASILMDPSGTKAYVFNELSQDISVIDIASRSVAATMPSEPGLTRGQFSRNGDVLYTTHEMSPFVRLVRPFPSLMLQQRYRTGMGTVSLKLDGLTNLIYMGKRFSNTVEVYEPSTFVSISSINIGGGATYMAIDGEQNNLYVVNGDGRSIDVVNLVTREVIGQFDVGEQPFRVSLMGER